MNAIQNWLWWGMTGSQFMDSLDAISSISPISVAIEDLIKQGQGQTCIVVNLEENTTITKIGPEGVKDIKVIPVGSKSILEKIKTKENSYSKAYEICKNTSIYTNDAYDLQVEENEFLPDIMPTLFEIVTSFSLPITNCFLSEK